MTAKAKQIRKDMVKSLQAIALQLNAIPERDDRNFPEDSTVDATKAPGVRFERQQQRAALRKRFAEIENAHRAMHRQALLEDERAAQARYFSEPVGNPQQESRRVADMLEAQRLAQPLIGQPKQMVRTRLLDEAQRFLGMGLPDRASVYVTAAELAGVADERLSQQVRSAVDETIPHRKQALADLRGIRDELDLFELDRASLRVMHGIAGTNDEAWRDRTAYQMAAYKAGVELGAGVPKGTETVAAGVATDPHAP